jgi:hypothetical protein
MFTQAKITWDVDLAVGGREVQDAKGGLAHAAGKGSGSLR